MASSSLNFIFWNACSLSNKLSDLKILARQKQPLLIGLCETWLHPKLTISFNGYTILRSDRLDRQGGGLALLIHASAASTSLPLRSFPGGTMEVLAATVSLPQGWASILVCYNPCTDVTQAELTH